MARRTLIAGNWKMNLNHLEAIRLVQRLGFRREGYSPEMLFIDGAGRDHERWAITTTMTGTRAEPHRSLPAH